MTVGEMLALTNRFKAILSKSISKQLRNKGLENMMEDMEMAYGIEGSRDSRGMRCMYAKDMYLAVAEAREL